MSMRWELFYLQETLLHEQNKMGWREPSPMLRAVLKEQYERRGEWMATPEEYEMLLDDPGYAMEVVTGLDEKTNWYAFGWAMGAGLFPPERVAEILVRRAMERVETDEGYDLLRRVLVRWGLEKEEING